uniref:Uncharacterized protein n=1 Tax=Avena sativa TaxID=4498 RepID=A0ACD6A7R7_AVESA
MSSKYFLFGLCTLLVLSGQRSLFPPALARDIPVSKATTFAPLVHAPAKDDAAGRRVAADQPSVGDQKELPLGELPPPGWFHDLPPCPHIFCGGTKAASATVAHP